MQERSKKIPLLVFSHRREMLLIREYKIELVPLNALSAITSRQLGKIGT
jgi:hypothetical protein